MTPIERVREARSAIMREIAELVRMGQPEGARVQWRDELIERDPVVVCALKIRKACDEIRDAAFPRIQKSSQPTPRVRSKK